MPKPRGDSEYRFDLKTRQGYDVSVVAVGSIVGLVVTAARDAHPSKSRPGVRAGAATAYLTRGDVRPGHIEASFGALGRVAVRFRPSGRVSKSKPRHHCKGTDHFTSRLGVFVGRVSFTGEDRYVSLRAHRAKGRIRSPLRLRCAGQFLRRNGRQEARPVRDLPSFSPTILAAGWREALASTEMLVLQIGKRTLFLAVIEISQGSMAEVQYAFTTASRHPSRLRRDCRWPARSSGPRWQLASSGLRAWVVLFDAWTQPRLVHRQVPLL